MSYRDEIIKQIMEHEGVRSTPYRDTEGNLTIGVGHNLEEGLSENVILLMLQEDIATAEAELDRIYPPWRELNKERRKVMVDMMFNLGAPRYLTFHKFWAAMMEKDYETAAHEMLDSKWANQVGDRAKTLAHMMRGASESTTH